MFGFHGHIASRCRRVAGHLGIIAGRLGIICGFALWLCPGMGRIASAEDSATQDLSAPFLRLADALAASGRDEAAKIVRQWVPADRGDQRVAFFPLSRLEIPSPALSEPKVSAAFFAARRKAAALAFTAAERAAAAGDAERALDWTWRATREDPTAEAPRRILGLPAGSASRVSIRIGTEAPPQLGWPPRSFIVAHTPHFRIFSTASRRQAVAMAEDLERYHAVWSQVFREVWISDAAVCQAIATGQPLARERKRVDVALFADRSAYVKALSGDATASEVSTGYYSPEAHLTLLYAGSAANGPAADPETRYHEITHQLLQETCGEVVEAPGAEAGFWIVEGIASYMESVQFFDSFATVGGWESPRLQYARWRWLAAEAVPSLEDLAGEGREVVQRREDLAAWYSTTAAYAHRLCDDPAKRPGLMRYLRSVYRGRPEAEAIELMAPSQPWPDQLERFLRLGDAEAYPLRPATSLRVLCLGRTRMTAERLAELPAQPALTWLDLGHLPVSDEIVQGLVTGAKLQRANLESTLVTDASARILAGHKSLSELDLSFTAVGDAGIEPLAGSREIEVLWLTGSRVTDASIPLLLGLRELRSLDVQRTEISPAGLARIAEARPDLRLNPLRLIPPSAPPSALPFAPLNGP